MSFYNISNFAVSVLAYVLTTQIGCGEGYTSNNPREDAGTPNHQTSTPKRLLHISASSNGPRASAMCPAGFALLGGGCSCQLAPSGWQPAVTASVQVGLPEGRVDTHVCECEVRRVSGQIPETTRESFATAQCLELENGPAVVEEIVVTEQQPDVCWPPLGTGAPNCGQP